MSRWNRLRPFLGITTLKWSLSLANMKNFHFGGLGRPEKKLTSITLDHVTGAEPIIRPCFR